MPRGGRLVVAIIRPSHPIQCAVDGIEVSLAWMKVGGKEHVRASGRFHLANIKAVAGKRRRKDLAIDLELCRSAAILSDLLADGARLAGVIPIEIKGDKNLHAIIGSRFVRKAQLLISVGVYTDVQRKGIDSQCFGTLHVVVIVGSTVAVAADTDLRVRF